MTPITEKQRRRYLIMTPAALEYRGNRDKGTHPSIQPAGKNPEGFKIDRFHRDGVLIVGLEQADPLPGAPSGGYMIHSAMFVPYDSVTRPDARHALLTIGNAGKRVSRSWGRWDDPVTFVDAGLPDEVGPAARDLADTLARTVEATYAEAPEITDMPAAALWKDPQRLYPGSSLEDSLH